MHYWTSFSFCFPLCSEESLRHQPMKTVKTVLNSSCDWWCCQTYSAKHLKWTSLIDYFYRPRAKSTGFSWFCNEPVWWWNEMRLRNGTVATVLAFITSFLTLSWYSTWQNGKGKEIYKKMYVKSIRRFALLTVRKCLGFIPQQSACCMLSAGVLQVYFWHKNQMVFLDRRDRISDLNGVCFVFNFL